MELSGILTVQARVSSHVSNILKDTHGCIVLIYKTVHIMKRRLTVR